MDSELKHIAPKLDQMDGSLGYTVPEGYFDGLAEHILIRCDEDRSSYFDTLPDRVLGQVRQNETPLVRLSWMKWVSAASLLLIYGSLLWMNREETTVPSVASNDIEYEYLLDEVDDIELSELIEMDIVAEDLLEVVETDISEDAIENILLDGELSILEELL